MNQYLLNIKDSVLKGMNRVIFFFIIIYLVGVAGISISFTSEFFTDLIPAVILLSLFTCLAFHSQSFNKRTIIVFLSIVILSFFLEAVAVRYGVIFGKYSYGTSLGPRVSGTPLIIGLNWLSLVYCTGAVTGKMNQSGIIKIIAASLLMLFYDILLEISAPGLNMWMFEDGKIPVRNYISWFVIAVIFHSLLKISRVEIINTTAQKIFAIQIVFLILVAII